MTEDGGKKSDLDYSDRGMGADYPENSNINDWMKTPLLFLFFLLNF
jgi:hypothetical protein